MCSLLFVAAVAGCGSSASSRSSSSSSTSTTTVAQPGHTRSDSKSLHATSKKLHATVYNPKAKSKQSGAKAAPQTKVSNRSSTAPQNPCTLVTRSEVEAVLHVRVSREIEAPLGPTCVFQVKGDKQSITIAVEVVDVSRELAQMKSKPTELNIQRHAAYCGVLGNSVLLVELRGGRALEVSAPCAVAEALAAKALPRVNA